MIYILHYRNLYISLLLYNNMVGEIEKIQHEKQLEEIKSKLKKIEKSVVETIKKHKASKVIVKIIRQTQERIFKVYVNNKEKYSIKHSIKINISDFDATAKAKLYFILSDSEEEIEAAFVNEFEKALSYAIRKNGLDNKYCFQHEGDQMGIVYSICDKNYEAIAYIFVTKVKAIRNKQTNTVVLKTIINFEEFEYKIIREDLKSDIEKIIQTIKEYLKEEGN